MQCDLLQPEVWVDGVERISHAADKVATPLPHARVQASAAGAATNRQVVADTIQRIAGGCTAGPLAGPSPAGSTAKAGSAGGSGGGACSAVEPLKLVEASKAAVDAVYSDFTKQVRALHISTCHGAAALTPPNPQPPPYALNPGI